MTSETWLKAAVIGSLWGASEIVLGSFLHNLKIPFSGNVLTAIGIILMVSGHRLWPERGLVIRAGIICAALKTLSPSANIFGPMLAITVQAALMEMALLAGRRTWIFYLLGGGLAMAWNIGHRIFTSIVLYGGTLIELYKRLLDYLIAQTGWQVEGYMLPLLVLAAIYFITGMAAAIAGIYLSSAARKQKHISVTFAFPITAENNDTPFPRHNNLEPLVTYQAGPSGKKASRLISSALAMAWLVPGLYTIARLPLPASLGLLLLFLLLAGRTDVRLVRRFLYRRGFWVSMGIMVVLSGYLLGRDDTANGFSMQGLRLGIEMMMRAMYVITGFGLISKELRNKNMISWFEKRRMKSLLMAINIAFQTTPLLIESIPGKQTWRRPFHVLTSMIGGMEGALEHMRASAEKSKK